MRKITKKDKILYTIIKMYNDKSLLLRYEDILVKVFKSFPEDFQIRFYPEFPDTDSIRRALYQLIPEGYIRISNRNCALTKEGIDKGLEIIKYIDGNDIQIDGRRDLNYNSEIKRLLALQGFNMFSSGHSDKIIDQDFYEFYRVSVRTRKLEIIGKINQTSLVIKRYFEDNKVVAEKINEYSLYLQQKFSELFKEEKK